MDSRKHVIVIGGGIAGLATAHRLIAADVSVTLLEQDDRLGGKILTERVDGFVVEGGPDAFLSWKPRGKAMCDELGIEVVGSNEDAKRAFVMRDGRLHPLPDGIAGVIPRRFVPTLRSPLLSPAGKLRLLMEWAVPQRRADGDESLGAFVRRRAGRDVWERIVEPLVTGVYAGDGEQLAVRATFPMLDDAEREHGSLTRAGIALRRSGRTPPPGPMFLTTADGLGGLVTGLVRELAGRADVQTGVRVTSLSTDGHAWAVADHRGRRFTADAVVIATPAHAFAALAAPLDAQLSAELSAIPYVSTATVTVAYPRAAVRALVHGHGYVLPRVEGSPIVACSITSTKFPVRARDGWVLIRAFVGRHGQPDPLNDDDPHLIDLVHREVARTLQITGSPAMARLYRWPEAIPQYTLGHADRVRRIRERVAGLPGLAVAGAAYRGIGIPDCISSGDEAADATRRHLGLVPNVSTPAE